MSAAKAIVMLQQLEQQEGAADVKRVAKTVREALADINSRLQALEKAASDATATRRR